MRAGQIMRKLRMSLVLVLLLCMAACTVSLPADRYSLPLGERERLDTFFSNFAEVFLPEFTLDAPLNSDLINFGVRHTYINRRNTLKRLEDGTLLADLEEVRDAVDKFFGRPVIPQSTDRYTYADGYFRIMPGEGDFAFAQVLELTAAANGFHTGRVAVYYAGSGFTGDVHGTPEAWERTDPENMPALGDIYRVKVSVSPRDSGRFILREYVREQGH